MDVISDLIKPTNIYINDLNRVIDVENERRQEKNISTLKEIEPISINELKTKWHKPWISIIRFRLIYMINLNQLFEEVFRESRYTEDPYEDAVYEPPRIWYWRGCWGNSKRA